MITIETAYGKITVENHATLTALVCALYDAEDWNKCGGYDACAQENRDWIKKFKAAEGRS